MNIIKNNTALKLFLLIFIFSCNKDSNTSSNSSSIASSLTDKKWYPEKYEYVTISTGFTIKEQAPTCESDDYWYFNKNGNYEYNYGSIDCGTNEIDENGIWQFSSDQKKIILDEDFQYTIESITNTTLVLSFEHNDNNNPANGKQLTREYFKIK